MHKFTGTITAVRHNCGEFVLKTEDGNQPILMSRKALMDRPEIKVGASAMVLLGAGTQHIVIS